MFKLRYLFSLFVALVLSISSLTAQNGQVGIHIGIVSYLGDLVPTSFTLKDSKLAYGAFYRHRISDDISVRGNLMLGKVAGDDANFPERRERGFSFETNFTEFAGMLEWNLNGKPQYDEANIFQKSTNFYIVAGIGGLIINPTTEGLPVNAPERAEDYSTFSLAIPIGLGIKFNTSETLSIGIEGTMRAPVSDYLDGISESANPDKNDWMGRLELSIAYTLKRKKNEEIEFSN